MIKNIKKFIKAAVAIAIILLFLVGCEEENRIHLISREAGSGTRDAFTELTGIKADGKDNTDIKSEISSSTFVVMTSVAQDEKAIGYVSLGTLNDKVKAIRVDGVEANRPNIQSGDYPLARDFNIIDRGEMSPLARDFVSFVMSISGQKIVEDEGFVGEEADREYEKTSEQAGRIVIAGSTSVAPLMEVLADRYKEIHPKVEIEIQQTGTGAGITSVVEGVCDLGIASRELKQDEIERGARETTMAKDGIVVIVNKLSPVDELTTEAIRQIFTGERTTWS